MRTRSRSVVGILLILAGVIFLTLKFLGIDFHAADLWPLIVLGIGLAFELSYFIKRKNAGILVPGGILTTIGILFFFEVMTGWRYSGYTWPIYILAVAIGFFQLYIFGGRRRGVFIAFVVMQCIFALNATITVLQWFSQKVDFDVIVSIGLIVIGIAIYLRKRSKHEE